MADRTRNYGLAGGWLYPPKTSRLHVVERPLAPQLPVFRPHMRLHFRNRRLCKLLMVCPLCDGKGRSIEALEAVYGSV